MYALGLYEAARRFRRNRRKIVLIASSKALFATGRFLNVDGGKTAN